MCTNAVGLAWVVNLGCIDPNPWPVRSRDVEHPDELRIDLDPQPYAAWDDVQQVALVAREVLADNGLVGFPETSGSRGIHINVRIEPKWTFNDGLVERGTPWRVHGLQPERARPNRRLGVLRKAAP